MPRKKLYRVDLEPARGLSILMVFGFHLLSIIIGYQNLPWDGWFRRLHFDIGWSMVPFVPLTLGWHGVAIFLRSRATVSNCLGCRVNADGSIMEFEGSPGFFRPIFYG